MKKTIKNKLRESLVNEYDPFFEIPNTKKDKWRMLEEDLQAVIEKNAPNFAEYEGDSYSVINAVYNVLGEMFPERK
jgi:hypothetical protein